MTKKHQKNRKLSKLLFAVTFTFVVLWSPNIIIRLMKHGGLHVNLIAYKFSQLLLVATTAVNFFIYILLSKDMRNIFKHLVCCGGCGGSGCGGSGCCGCGCCCGSDGVRNQDVGDRWTGSREDILRRELQRL